MTDDYDPQDDAYRSWHVAVAEIRRRGVLAGEYAPMDEEERALVEERWEIR